MPYLTHWTYDVAPLYNSYKSLTTLSVFFDKKATDIPIFLCKFATLNEKTTIFTTMRVLIVNTSERTGGAAIAANRLKDALNNSGVKTMMLVTDKETDDITVAALPHKWLLQWHFLWERWCIFLHLHFKRRHLFEIDIANSGSDITGTKEFQEADVIHLNWINQGMLSLKSIQKILQSGKPVVWTMHDMWPATGICHLTLGCRNFEQGCANCQYLPGGGGRNDVAAKVWRRKKKLLDKYSVAFVACSQWLANEAKASALLRGQRVESIPNAIDTRVFHPQHKSDCRNHLHLPAGKKLILFVSQRVTNVNKGMDYLIRACKKLVTEQPTLASDTAIVGMGGHAEEIADKFDLPVYPLGYINNPQLASQAYSACDVFVLPSLSENLPNTIMEAMACGLPCVGFNVGGIPEEIDHLQNGYVARYQDSDDLERGIEWVLTSPDYALLSQNAVSKVAAHYSQQSVANQYIKLYNKVLDDSKRRI